MDVSKNKGKINYSVNLRNWIEQGRTVVLNTGYHLIELKSRLKKMMSGSYQFVEEPEKY